MAEANDELRALAREREARARSRGGASSSTAPAATPRTVRPPNAPSCPLLKAHRSVRIAHSLALISCSAGLLLGLCHAPRPGLWSVGLLLTGLALGRSGGAFVHGLIPQMLREGSAPSELELRTSDGLFSLAALGSLGAQLALEWGVFVENLAFVCTYGKKNCLTNDMYSGQISIGKIWTLVGAKLREGVIRCN